MLRENYKQLSEGKGTPKNKRVKRGEREETERESNRDHCTKDICQHPPLREETPPDMLAFLASSIF